MFINRQAFKPEEVLKYISDPLVIIDENLKIIKVNEKFTEKYSAHGRDFSGEDFLFFVKENLKESTRTLIIEMLYKKEPADLKISDTIGNVLEVKKLDLPFVIIGNGNVAFILKDVTFYEKTIEEIGLAKESAERKNLETGQRLAELNHEIKMSAGGMRGIIDYLMETRIDEQQKKYLTILKKTSDSIIQQMGSIVESKDYEIETLKLLKNKFDLESLVDEVVSIYIGNAYAKNVEILYYVDKDIPPRIIGDSVRLKQVLNNLVGNAVKFSHNGEILVFVKKVEEDEESVIVEFIIKDTGIGMSKEKLEKIEDYLNSGVKNYKEQEAKNGIGFIISQKFIELMGGTLKIKSVKGIGTTVYFRALFHKTEEKTVLITENVITEKNFSVIFADENLKSRIVISKILKDMGFKVYFCGRKRFEQKVLEIQGNKLIIADTKVARKEILEFLDNISEREDVRIVLMKCWPDDRRYRELERYPFVSKPFSKNDIQIMMRNIDDAFKNSGNIKEMKKTNKTKDNVKILLVEDNKINQELTTILIKKMGWGVEVASNGREAVEKFQNNTYSLILMDIQMPEMNGIEATRMIREIEKSTGERIGIIAMTAYAIEGDREKCFEAGMDEYLSKPLKVNELYELIRKCLKINEVKQESVCEDKTYQTLEGDPVNMEELYESVGRDSKILNRMIEITMKNYPSKLLRIKESIEQKDFKTMEYSSHGFKGSIGSISKKVFNLSGKIEQKGREGNYEGVEDMFVELEKEMKDIEAFFEKRNR